MVEVTRSMHTAIATQAIVECFKKHILSGGQYSVLSILAEVVAQMSSRVSSIDVCAVHVEMTPSR